MEKAATQNIQDAILNTSRREKRSVTVGMIDGSSLTGKIRSFDKFSLLLETVDREVLIFKHSISTITVDRN
ncbi:MAG: RNA chaperone Hfq [Acidobacteriota bacterium]